MPLSKHLSAFTREIGVLDALLAAGGGTWVPRSRAGEASRGTALHAMQRLYQTRRLWRDQNNGRSPWDGLEWGLECGCASGRTCAHPIGCLGHVVRVRLAPEEELFDPAGAPLAPAQASAEGFAPREAEPEWDDLLTQLRAAKTKAKRPLITEEGTEE